LRISVGVGDLLKANGFFLIEPSVFSQFMALALIIELLTTRRPRHMLLFIAALGDRIHHVHAKDGEIVAHNVARSGLLAHGRWDRRDRGFRFRVPGWGSIDWKRVLTELKLAGYAGAISVEHEDPTMGRVEGLERARATLAPLLLRERLEPRWW